MEKINIIYVDDQREVLTTIGKDLEVFEDNFVLEECESAAEAIELMDEIDAAGDFVGVIISDHVMPGKSGVDFLSEVNDDNRFEKSKMVLLTGMATHQDTIHAINNACIDRYIEKPWDSQELIKMVRELLTLYILSIGIDVAPYKTELDQNVYLKELQKGREM